MKSRTSLRGYTKLACGLLAFSLLFVTEAVFAQAPSGSIGAVAKQVVQSFQDLAKLITAVSYVAGMGFAIGAIMKFKMHKDNPTQVPIGTPIALIFIAAALIFLPTIFKVAGDTLFGSGGTKQMVGGTSGTSTFGVQ